MEERRMTATTLTGLSCVLFDLDGTLVDSAPGITACLAETIREFGGPSVRPASLRSFVGPPVIDTLRTLTSLPERQLPAAIENYRARYLATGLQQSSVFAGIPALLAMLREWGVLIAVATSKRESHARAILELHSLTRYFAVVSGAGEDEAGASKSAVIVSALERLGARGSSALMIGDRSFDIRGAAATGIPSMFAEWGYGTADEAQGAAFVAHDPHRASALLHEYLVASATQPQGAS
jgi:phosphoglycolate phosphatase